MAKTDATGAALWERQCPAQPVLIGLGCSFAIRAQCSQCAGDIGSIGLMVISIASSCGMGMEAACAIDIMHRLPKKVLARNTPARRIFILI